MGTFNDGYTDWITLKMDEWTDRIYDIEDGISTVEDNEEKLIEYLKDIQCSLPLGLALRRYLCGKYASFYNSEKKTYSFQLTSGKTVEVSEYQREDYDIQNDDIAEYVDIFLDINSRFNTDADGSLLLEFTRAEARRLLRLDSVCQRSKMFLISFALHMDADEMYKFLTDVLAEQTYNFRSPEEIIAYFCQSHVEYNSYAKYLELNEEFELIKKDTPVSAPKKENYTSYAKLSLNVTVDTVEELMKFLKENLADFQGYSQTAYSEFMMMYDEALERTKFQALSNDEYLNSADASTYEQRIEQETQINRAIGLQQTTKPEQLARAMLRCIPRATTKKVKNGKTIISTDFISISNGEKGQKNKKVNTTMLPKEITMNLLMRDRLDDLTRQIKPVERKDLVFLKFYLFSLDLEEHEYTATEYQIFLDECNDMLLRCGMSKLYLANRFENLVMLSLLSSNPFELFEDIIEYSFINEPGCDEE